MWAKPASKHSLGVALSTRMPLMEMLPDSTPLRPAIASTSSDWPFPCTPATAKTSPRFTVKLMLFTTATPRSSRTTKSFTSRTGAPGLCGPFLTWRLTDRPTIFEASSSSLSVGSPVPTILPRRMTVILSATARTSLSLCEIKRMDFPEAAKPFMILIRDSISCGVRTAVGSSRMSSSASWERALRISTRC